MSSSAKSTNQRSSRSRLFSSTTWRAASSTSFVACIPSSRASASSLSRSNTYSLRRARYRRLFSVKRNVSAALEHGAGATCLLGCVRTRFIHYLQSWNAAKWGSSPSSFAVRSKLSFLLSLSLKELKILGGAKKCGEQIVANASANNNLPVGHRLGDEGPRNALAESPTTRSSVDPCCGGPFES